MSSPSPGAHRRSSRGSRVFKRVLIGVLVLANLAVGAVYWRLRSVENVLQTTVSTIPEVVPDLTPTTPERQDATTFLLIGSDSREGLEDLTNFGEFEGQRADVIMLIQIHPESDVVQILSIPRDLWVEIPGHGENRINAAYSFGGAPLMVRTVKEATGLAVNHYIEVDFVGFKAIVDEMGGVAIDFPYPARDTHSGLRVEAGRQILKGDEALAYARSRHYQELQNGSWTPVDANDIGRTRRQQQLIFSILSQLTQPSNLAEAGSIVESFAEHLSMDSALAESSLIELAFAMRGFSAEKMEAATLPTTGATIGGAAVLLAQEPEAGRMIDAFRSGESLVAAAEGPKRLTVLNGNGISGSAGEWSEFLEEHGFEIAGVGDAERKDFQITKVLVRPGQLDVGQLVVDTLGFGSVDVGNVQDGIDALVVVGRDAQEVTAGGGSSG